MIDLGPRYEFRRELGSGGMGRVVLVWDRHLERELALKRLHQAPEEPEELILFQREFALLSRVDHPHIARAIDFGFHEGVPYFTSEFVEGLPLSRAEHSLSPAELARWGSEIATALGYLHQAGVLHLDVKPGNIVLTRPARGAHSPARAVLVDFGLVRRATSPHPGARLRGSLPFLAPEYFREGSLGPWTDLYALGVTLYWLITGYYPRRGANEDAPRLDVESAWEPAPRPPSQLRPGFPAALDGPILRCLALDPSVRYAHARELASALVQGTQQVALDGASQPTICPVALDLVGRDEDLAAVDRFLAAAARTECGALLMTGAEGLGQTRLLQELKVRAQTGGLACFLERGFPGRPCPPGALWRSLAIHLGPEAGTARERWEGFLERLRRPRAGRRSDASEGERRQRRVAELALAARAIVKPMVLAVDGLQCFDEVSIALLVDWVRQLQALGEHERPPLLPAIGYREEGSAAGLLRELTQALLRWERASVLTLKPLGLLETRALMAQLGAERADDLSLLQDTGGVPARIVSHALGAAERPAAATTRGSGSSGQEICQKILIALAAIERPATGEELEAFTGIGHVRLQRALSTLEDRGLAIPAQEAVEQPRAWVLGVSAGGVLRPATAQALRRTHLAIARTLQRRAPKDASLLVEAVRHFQAAGCGREVVRWGPRAARYLKATFQNQAALEVYRAVIAAAPASARGLRLEAAIECCDLHVWSGETEAGLRLLREALPTARSASPAAHVRVLHRLATLHARRGESRRAANLFEEAKQVAARARGLTREELLLALNEEAALKTVVGDYEGTLALCRKGLRLAGRSRRPSLREAAMNLHATRANVALRCFDHAGATADFEKALEIAEAIGSSVNQAVILNNLGITYSQIDRYAEAVRAYRDAEEACLRLDEGPSLVSIYGNLAVLHAKLGDFTEASRALDLAGQLGPRLMGKRQELFHKYAQGLTLLYRGRFAAAAPHLEAGLDLARAMGDRHVTQFAAIYRAEALAGSGQLDLARSELEPWSQPERPARARRMANARLAFVEALAGRKEAAQAAISRQASLLDERPVPFLEATSSAFLAWAHLLGGQPRECLSALERPGAYFRACGLRPFLGLCSCLAADAWLMLGDRPVQEQDLDEAMRSSDLAEALGSLVRAGGSLASSATLTARARAADWLARASAALSTSRFAAGDSRLEALRKQLQAASGQASPGEPSSSAALPVIRDQETRDLSAGRPGQPATLRASLVARSPRMHALCEHLDRLRGKDLPVLICGETGTGKELIARILHEESPRAQGPFVVLDCATLPAPLMEAELFGVRAGAYTDVTVDRAGILSLGNGGTVLIDAVESLPLEAQAKLLRVLAEGKARPVGAEHEVALDVRFVFSTAADLASEVAAGRFRSDLLYRLGIGTLNVPPLRERHEDFPELVSALSAGGVEEPLSLAEEALNALISHPWPGNVRELHNLLLRLRLDAGATVRREQVERLLGAPRTRTVFPRNLLASETLPALRDRLERDYLVHHYRRLQGDSRALCAFLGLGRRQLYRWCARLGLRLRESR